jgi:hypothetical protein
MMNPYLVVKNLDINQVEDELNKQWNNGYKALEIIPTGGGSIAIVFVMRTAAAAAERSTVAGAFSSQ